MQNENEKKGLFGRLFGGNKSKSGSCCGGYELEAIPDESGNKENDKKNRKGSCCCNFELEEIPDDNERKNDQ
ncbi:hypothetical protein [Desulfitobacterium sp. AusDCA]|uniref:hypothetical protein n=1 Tax=Desulfitobacterium sp. AusDCA TaxID=3240383 RepID=UPI003DA6D1FD